MGSPVHVLMLSIQAVCGLPRLRAPGIVPFIISFSRQLPCSSWCDLLWRCLAVPPTPAMLRTHSFVFFAVHKTRRIFLSPFVSNVTYTQWTVRDRQQSLTVCYTCCKLWLKIIAKSHANYAICCTCIMHSWTYNSSCNKVMWQWNCRWTLTLNVPAKMTNLKIFHWISWWVLLT